MVLEENFKSYFEALKTLNLQTLKLRRKNLTLRFAQSLADGKLRELFHLRRKQQIKVFTLPLVYWIEKQRYSSNIMK